MLLRLRRLPIDPWGHSYRFAQVGSEFWPISAGPDEEFDTTDDVTLSDLGACRVTASDQIRWF